MNALRIIGIAVGGGFGGSVLGFIVGLREGGDFNIAPLYTTPVGGVVGLFVGMVVGVCVWA